MKSRAVIALLGLAVSAGAQAEITVQMNKVNKDGTGDSVGTVTVSETRYGVVLTPDLSSLDPGVHGFHLHENGSCEPSTKDGKVTPAGAAGGHYDPKKTGMHGAPWGKGHLGDLPPLYVDKNGNATTAVLAPRLKMKHLDGRALMVHAGGDNFSDEPAPLGGGGSRVACGVAPAK